MSTAVTTIPAEEETRLDLGKMRSILQGEPDGADRMTRVLYKTHSAYGYLPWTAAELIAIEFGKTMTDVYTTASLLSNFRGAPEGEGTAVPRGGRRFTGNLAIAGSAARSLRRRARRCTRPRCDVASPRSPTPQLACSPGPRSG